jgi:hypothetical protein
MMKLLVLLVFVFIGTTSGQITDSICPDGHTALSPPEAGETDRSTIFTFEDLSCGTEKIGHDGSSAMSSSEWAAAMNTGGSDCTPAHGECWDVFAAVSPGEVSRRRRPELD